MAGMSVSPALRCPVQPLALTGQETGIDLGLESFATLADGTMIHNPRCYRKAERRLKTAQRRVARRKKGSTRRRKAVRLLAKAHQHVRRQRQDFQHKAALNLVREYDTIYHEDLQVANLLKNHHLAKSIADAGWSAIPEHPCVQSSIRWEASDCGESCVYESDMFWLWRRGQEGLVRPLALRARTCGTSLHRDHNAALNILRLGKEQSTDGQSVQALTWPDGASVA